MHIVSYFPDTFFILYPAYIHPYMYKYITLYVYSYTQL